MFAEEYEVSTVPQPAGEPRPTGEHPTGHDHHHGKHAAVTTKPSTQVRQYLRPALIPLMVGLLIGSIFAAVYLAAFHDPKPHELPVGVVAPTQVVGQLQQASTANDDAFDITTYDTREQAQTAVADHDVYGALVVAADGVELIVAGANGPSVTQTLQGAFTPVAAAAGTALTVTDVQPLAAGDSRGLSVFYAAFGIVLGAFLFGLTLMGVGRQLPYRWQAGSAVAFSLLAGLVVAWLVDPAFDALPAPYLLATVIIAMLGLAIAAGTAALLQAFGSAGTFVASIVLLTLGNATSTGILPAQFLPGWLEPLTHVLPVGVAVEALRGAAYFDDDGVGTAFAVLTAWVFISSAVFVLVGQRKARTNTWVQTSPAAG